MKKWTPRSVLKVQALAGFKIKCFFDNGEIRQFDMAYIKKEKGTLLKDLRNLSYFKKVFVEMGSPTWPNGYDVCADLIYRDGAVVAVKKNVGRVA